VSSARRFGIHDLSELLFTDLNRLHIQILHHFDSMIETIDTMIGGFFCILGLMWVLGVVGM
jgi:hypothetical protein